MELEAALAQAALPQPNATELRKALAAANGNRPLLDGMLGPGSFASARAALTDIVALEKSIGAAWVRPAPSLTWPDVMDFIVALLSTHHAAATAAPPGTMPPAHLPPSGSAPAAHAPLPGAAQHPLYAANPPGLQASYPFTAAQKVSAATDATLGLSHSVLAPLTASTAIHCEHLRTQANSVSGGPPLAPALEAQRLCVAFGQPAVAHHLSSGRCTRDVSGESIARTQHDSREAMREACIRLTREGIGPSRAARVTAAAADLASTVSHLRGIQYEAVIVLWGGEETEISRGERAPDAGSAVDGLWGDVSDRAHVKRAFAFLGRLPSQTLLAHTHR